MRVGIIRCKHCGTKYNFLFSGFSKNIYSKSQDYCISCYEAVTNALYKIPVKFVFKYIKTNEIDIDIIKKWENEEIISNFESQFPKIKRVFAESYDNDMVNHTVTKEIKGKEGKYKNVSFIYKYWTDKPQEYDILIKKEIKYLEDGTFEEVGYWID